MNAGFWEMNVFQLDSWQLAVGQLAVGQLAVGSWTVGQLAVGSWTVSKYHQNIKEIFGYFGFGSWQSLVIGYWSLVIGQFSFVIHEPEGFKPE